MATYNLVQFVWSRELIHPELDDAINTVHIREVVAGAPDILPVTDEGRQDFIDRVNVWHTETRLYQTTKIYLRELRFYDVPSGPGIDMGDPVLVHNVNLAGTAVGTVLPQQIAVSITWKTSKRLWWGRIYFPGLTVAALSTDGQVERQMLDQLAQSSVHLTNRSWTGAAAVVFSRKHWTHLDIDQVQVDDVFDVVRSRRANVTTYRAITDASP